MSSAEQSSKIVIEGVATIQHLIRHSHAELVIEGDSPEAEADRLLIAGEYVEAVTAYQGLGPLDRRQREKLSYAMWARGIDEAWDELTLDYHETSFEGLLMQLRAFGGVMWRSEVDDAWLKDFALTVTGREDLRSRDALLAATIYIAASLSRYRFSEDLYPEVCLEAVQGLRSSESPYSLCLEAFALSQKARFKELHTSALVDLVSRLDPPKCPVLGFGFVAAVRVNNPVAARAFVAELCRRFPNHPYLSNTVAIASVQARDPSILDEAPEPIRSTARLHPEVQLITALADKKPETVEKALHAFWSTPNDQTLHYQQHINEPFFQITCRTWDEGTWSTSPYFIGELAAKLVQVLPAGASRDRVLMELEVEMATEPEQAILRPFVVDLFNRQPTAEVANLFPDSIPFDGVAVDSMARFIFEQAMEDDPYCSSLDPEFEPDVQILIDRGVPEHLMKLVRQVPDDKQAACVRTLTEWGLFKAPEHLVTFAFEHNLRGRGLSPELQANVAAIRQAIQISTPDQMVYLQAILDGLSIEVQRSTTVAAQERTVLEAANEVLHLKDRSLNDLGQKRVKELVKRYGAAKLLPGLSEITKQPQAIAEGQLIDALSKHMVVKQGSLAGRRSYLAGILRKRLVNLKSTWLDLQVSECLNRGIDVEQMIELSKTVTTWDEWTAGLVRLAPY
ncbi:hypothetical protein [Pseudomonas poae]|uniref:Uncharacterized protein n=1 Tax=Pseudomonas poae TaxID=200451 RepID=A0ABY0RBX1_9PSED|nr:hypothetical protein [Pseudomonas poae]KRP45150.1 hypothetical protein TU75_20775 [Pseudomonas poae]SDN55612.1 hypothetical protein SAMN04490208_0685 [Pseudomonas poae]